MKVYTPKVHFIPPNGHKKKFYLQEESTRDEQVYRTLKSLIKKGAFFVIIGGGMAVNATALYQVFVQRKLLSLEQCIILGIGDFLFDKTVRGNIEKIHAFLND